MICSRCQSENPEDSLFCEECGARLEHLCPACGATVTTGKKFCRFCGHNLTAPAAPPAADTIAPGPEIYTPKHLAERILNSRGAIEGERKQVTVLFADIKGSTELITDLDPEQVSKRLDPALKAMMDAVHTHEGTVNKVQGDGIMALFGAPIALEDHAVRACNAALDMQKAAKAIAGDDLIIRVGIHSGEVVVRSIGNDLSMDYDAIGATVHLAGRMEQLAEPGSILMTDETFRQAEGFVETRSLGLTEVRGLAEPIELFELTGRTAATGRWDVLSARGLTRLAGRDTELANMDQALERAGAGEGQIVALVGDAGIGKSRLVHEFIHSGATRDWAVRTASAAPHGKNIPYLPVAGLLRALFDVADTDSQADIDGKLRANITALDESLLPVIPALQSVLDLPVADPAWIALDPPARRRRIQDAVKALALRRARSVPVLLVFEDLHWIDSETQAVLDALADVIGAARLMLLVTYRPEYAHNWAGKSYYSRIRIDPLSDDTSSLLLDSLLGDDPGLSRLKRLLIERTAGRPLFQEETVRAFAETGVLTGERGNYRLAGEIDDVEVPASVQAVLAARIDRLPPDQKDVLHISSVVGRVIPVPLLEAVTGQRTDSLREILAQLQAAEFLFETRVLPNLEYTFKHALTHDVAYGSILLERRKALHGQLVDIIERLYRARLDEHVEQLADHAVRGELWDKAAIYCREAGTKAMQRSAHAEAIVYLNNLLDVLAHLPQDRESAQQAIDIHLDLRAAYGATGDVRKMAENLQRARELAESIDDRVRGAWITVYTTSVVELRGNLETAIPEIERAQRIARDVADGDLLRMTSFVLCAGHMHRGDYTQALATMEPYLAEFNGAYRHARFGMTGTWSLQAFAIITIAHLKLGRLADALHAAEECRRIGEEVDRPFDLGIADWALGSALLGQERREEAISVLERGLDVCRNSGTYILVPILAGPLAYAYATIGQHDKAARLAKDAWSQLRSTSVFWLYVWLYAPLAAAMLETGDTQSAREVAAYACELARKMGMRDMEAENRRILDKAGA